MVMGIELSRAHTLLVHCAAHIHLQDPFIATLDYSCVDNPIVLDFGHEHKAQWVVSIGVVNKMFAMFVCLTKRFKA